AVYRISGVFAVIGGWFLTAIIAFTVSCLIALLISLGGKIMIFVFIAVAVFMVVRTHIMFKNRAEKKLQEEEDEVSEKDEVEKVAGKCHKQVVNSILSASKIFSVSIESFLNEDRGQLKEGLELKNELNRKSKKQKNKVLTTLSKIEDNVDSGHYYVQVVDYQREVAHSLNFTIEPLFEHLNNNHKPFTENQAKELKNLTIQIDEFMNFMLHIVKENKFELIGDLIEKRDKIVDLLAVYEKAQIKRIKGQLVNTRNSLLFFNTLTETKNMLLHFINLIKAYRDFITLTKKHSK
ncbi:MAG: phosphate permease, partial [Prolixibacteraceae bacterium]|nr:phosphate permease [Prolixibacteraceae bacterium]